MRKFLILIILSIFIIPFSSVIPIRGQPIWYGQYLGLLFCLFLGISFVLWQFNKWLSIFTGVCLLSTFFVANMSPRSIMLLVQFDLACLASYGISKFNKRHRKIILWAIVGLILVQGLWLALQANNIPIKIGNTDLTFVSRINPGKKELVGLSGAADQIGTFFALTLPTALYIFPPLALLSLAGLIISKSSFAFAAGILSGLVYLLFTNRKAFIIATIICLILGGVFFLKVDKLKSADFQMRFKVWEHSIKSTIDGRIKIIKNGRNLQVETNRFTGFGFGNFIRIFPYVPQSLVDNKFNYADEKFTHAHNDYVEAFFELKYGIIILFLLIGGFIKDFLKLRKNKEAVLYGSCVLAYLLNATGNFCSQLALSGMLLILCFGMFQGVRREIYG